MHDAVGDAGDARRHVALVGLSGTGKTALALALAAEIGAARVELYTGPYYDGSIGVDRYAATAEKAVSCGVMVNAGHDLDLQNLARFLQIKAIQEVSIGHALMVECIEQGMPAVVKQYLQICSESA